MVRRRLFIHTTFDCRFDGVCRDDCYLLAGKSDEDKQIRLPDEYWVNVVELAGQYGFEELSLPINPLKGVTGIKDPLHWLRLLAPVAKKYGMVINVTTTMEVAQHILPSDQVDIVAISVDEYRVGEDWKKKADKLTRITNYLRHIGVETNANISLDQSFVRTFVLQQEYWSFIRESFDYITVLVPKASEKEAIYQMKSKSRGSWGPPGLYYQGDTKYSERPLLLREILTTPGLIYGHIEYNGVPTWMTGGEGPDYVPETYEEGRAHTLASLYHNIVKDIGYRDHEWGFPLEDVSRSEEGVFELIEVLFGKKDQTLIDYCLAHRVGHITCDAGHGQLSLDARGWLAICPYNKHFLDVSNIKLFESYLRDTIPATRNIPYCELVETTRIQTPGEDGQFAYYAEDHYIIGDSNFFPPS